MNDFNREKKLLYLAENIQYSNCGCAVLDLALKYFGYKNGLSLQPETEWGSWIVDLANEVVSIGYKPHLYSYSTNMFLAKWFSLSQEELFVIMETVSQTMVDSTLVRVYHSLTQYLSRQGLFTFRIVTAGFLQREVAQNKMIILNVESKSFHLDNDVVGGHYCLLLNLNARNARVLTPTPNGFRIVSLPTERLLFSMYRWGSWALVITP